MQSHEKHAETGLTAVPTLTVASLNLHCGVDWRGDPFDVAAAICRLDATVICLQEAWLPEAAIAGNAAAAAGVPPADMVADAARMLGADLYRVPQRSGLSLADFGLTSSGPAGSGSGDLCLAMLTTLPVTDYEVRPLGRAPSDHVPRLAQVIRLRLADGTSIRVANTHLTHRLTSPAQLRRLWRYLRLSLGPAVIAGDLNMPRLIAARLAGFRPAVSGRSWPAWQPLIQLDHLLVSREIGAVAGSVLAQAGSDHLPVRATIAIQARPRPETAERRSSPHCRTRSGR